MNTNKERIAEICCGSYEDAIASYKGGAKRIELNQALYLGGLTPSLASLLLTKQNTNLTVITMIRTRGAGYCYNAEEFEVMKMDAELMMKNGADGLAFGCLNKDSSINIEQTKIITDIVKKYNGEAVFHRAFDCVSSPFTEIEKLIDLGIDRLLTSGQQPKAMDGLDLIKKLQNIYGDKIQILVGSGVNAGNALHIMEETGIYQVHSSCKDWKNDPTTVNENNPSLNYSYAPLPNNKSYEYVNEELVRNLTKVIQ